METKHLGKIVDYVDHYQPDLLQAIPRQLKRDELGIDSNKLPFHGQDFWNGYELSWLNHKGKPQVAHMECQFDCETPNLIESKSFKLYLNSFNQTSFSSWEDVQKTIHSDLAREACGDVSVILRPLSQGGQIEEMPGICLDDLDIDIHTYQHDESLLEIKQQAVDSEQVYSHLLKSNCLITGQPDWASVMIQYTGPAICHESLLRYLISFRQHNEFHEQCVERIYQDIMTRCVPEKLAVYARYTRRGGLDINPLRANFNVGWGNMRMLRQ